MTAAPLTQDQRDNLYAASSVLLDWADLLGATVAQAAEELYAETSEARRAHADLSVREAARRLLGMAATDKALLELWRGWIAGELKKR